MHEYGYCGLCSSFPCALIKDFSYDTEHGDNGECIIVLEELTKIKM